MRFDELQALRRGQIGASPPLLDAAETNVYRTLAALRPEPPRDTSGTTVHRCDLARTWLRHFELPAELAAQAVISRGVRHGLGMVFQWLSALHPRLWLPSDVYPVYFDLAQAAGISPATYPTLPKPTLPCTTPDSSPEYLLLTNPSKPLGRHLSDAECTAVIAWLQESPNRRLLIDTVYDLGVPFAAGTRRLLGTGRAVILHSVTKGWLWPRTFGVVLLGPEDTELADTLRADPPSPAQLRLAEHLLTEHDSTPQRVVTALAARAHRLFERLPEEVLAAIPPVTRTYPGNYFFPVEIPAETLRHEYRILAMPISVFGENNWPGSVLTSLAVTFDSESAAA
ncbi:aminotransferase class I/II-fold pyridoxal phosphate-dependent enzyme [Actinospica sp. MGRD01-02]|uniref:Aminotransferase class I/II-fold pyridoxal phosphate-dependent enzyme n=1 Tax=Actinospica acidithermotolerans TaxID=2828514 RepID=A0A941EDI9_9ACTN|nr:aminotransferase class I/II-fold pyridoxal phosphate-dependent enzyme [Actinospica acidithermotolerans]MBR7825814.1 aminotransferase class I/II-fold pyridoxal phosphate-dependent enzyme [Actinospica acidithermotolerans]